MNKFDLSPRTITGLAIATLLAQPLAGCSGATSSLPTAPVSADSAHAFVPAAVSSKSSAPQRTAAAAKTSLLYVADNLNSKIYVFDEASKTSNPPVLETITDGISFPNGIATDTEGNLWVANLGSDTVTEYAPNSSTPRFTISNDMTGPYDVKVDDFGNVFVAMSGNGGPNSIVEYGAGTADPIYTYSLPQSNMQLTGIALVNPQLKGETSVYATEFQSSGSGGATGGLLTCIPGNYPAACTQDTSYLYGETGGIAIANQGGSKPFEFLAVDQYLPGVDETIPSSQSVKQLISGGTPEGITLNSKGNRLFIADRFYGQVEEYTFPGNKELITFGVDGKTQLSGVATYPSGNYR
jgi:sugar lactone lactonase YvrE